MLANGRDDDIALVDAATDIALSYQELDSHTAARQTALAGPKSVVFVFMHNSISSVLAYLSALRAGHVVALLDSDTKPEFAADLIDRYQPEHLYFDRAAGRAEWPGYRPNDGDTFLSREHVVDGASPHPDLAILLSTSGSTGSPKFVRLSRANIRANTEAIVESLRIVRTDRAATTLPLHYSYGMSVLNSHLAAGARVLVTDASVVENGFWESVKHHAITSLAGVPYTYQTLHRLGFATMELPPLRSMTQAGGRMAESLVRSFDTALRQRDAGLYVMYGQTEAGPRMTCLPAQRLAEKFGSVGPALPGGRLAIRTEDALTTEPGVSGEVVYTGENVMMGYASARADCALGDTNGDTLHTGDIGHLDHDGYLFLAGRSKRITKLFGLRVSLDDVERMLAALGPVAAVGGSDQLVVFHEELPADVPAAARKQLSKDLHVPVHAVRFRPVPSLPTLSNGKLDYRTLEAMAGGRT